MISVSDTARGLHAPKYDGRVGHSARAGLGEPECIALREPGPEHDRVFIDRLPARNVPPLQANKRSPVHNGRTYRGADWQNEAGRC